MQCIVIGPVCAFETAGGVGGRVGGVRTLLQPARAQCLRLSERFFHALNDFTLLVGPLGDSTIKHLACKNITICMETHWGPITCRLQCGQISSII